MEKKDKFKAIKLAMRQLEKQTKTEGLIQILGEKPEQKIERFSTGKLGLDIALGGGIPVGRVLEFFGPESSGKSLLSTLCMAEVQKKGGVAFLLDAENSFDPEFAQKLGLNTDELIVSQETVMERGLTILDKMIDTKAIDIAVVDSVAALAPLEEVEGEIGKKTMGLAARIMSPFLRKIVGKCAKNNVTVIFINQYGFAI